MLDLKSFIKSPNLLSSLLSLSDEELFSYFKELSRLDFYLNRYGMKTKHTFTVLNHTKKLLKNFDLALKYRDDKALYERDLVNSTIYKKDFFRRVISLLDELDLKTDSDDFRVIVLVLLLHDIGKYSYDVRDDDIKEQSRKSIKAGKPLSIEYLKLYYRNKGHEERGAFLVFSNLEEAGLSQIFAARVRNLIMGHSKVDELAPNKEFAFFSFLRQIMTHTTTYKYPILKQERPADLLMRELNINYLVYVIDLFSVDDTGNLWYMLRVERETVYMKAKWFLSRKLNDLLSVLRISFFNSISKDKQMEVEKVLKLKFLQGFRSNTNFLLEMEFDNILTSGEKTKLRELIKSYFYLTDKMYPFYLNNTDPDTKFLHMDLLSISKEGSFALCFIPSTKDFSVDIHFVKSKAYEGTLLKLVKAIILSSIENNRAIKIVQLLAYSGEDSRLIDIITVRHKDGTRLTEEMLTLLTSNLKKCEQAGYTTGELLLPISKEDFDNRIKHLSIELSDVSLDSRTFQELRVSIPVVSNLTIYCCLKILSYINIVMLRVEELFSSYTYIFVISQLNSKYKVTSAAGFKKDLVKELSTNVVISS